MVHIFRILRGGVCPAVSKVSVLSLSLGRDAPVERADEVTVGDGGVQCVNVVSAVVE